jgi:hypothetical protein
MRRLIGVAAVTALLAGAAPAGAGIAKPVMGFTSSNVEYLSTVPFDAGMPTGGRLVGKYFYVAGTRALSIYDVSTPESPQLVSTTHLGFVFANEDVDTNGKILLMSGDTHPAALFVYDVTDKANPKEIGRIDGLKDHTFSCVLKCKWAYGAGGNIIDLRDPSDPKVVGNWNPGMPVRFDGFDVTEVAPGIVVTSSRTIRMLDARKNPAKPATIALGSAGDNRLIHTNHWPRKGKDRFLLVQGETPLTQRCNGNSGAFMTWDASRWRDTRTFGLIDEFRVGNGTHVDGNPPAGVWGCTNMWFQHHPSFKNGGLVASGFFEHGARFLNVDGKGKISELGYFTPVVGSTIATYWITDDIVYALDLYRGIDILRFSNS